MRRASTTVTILSRRAAGRTRQLGIELGIGRNRLRYRCRLTDTAGLDDDIIEFAGLGDIAELFDKVHLQRTADATVRERHKTVVALTDDAVLGDKALVNIHLTDVVDDDGETYAALVAQDAVDERCLATAKITGEQQYRISFTLLSIVSFLLIFPPAKVQILCQTPQNNRKGFEPEE